RARASVAFLCARHGNRHWSSWSALSGASSGKRGSGHRAGLRVNSREPHMYCPSCGVDNHSEVKFCTRCGTNLGIVTEALATGHSRSPQTDDRIRELLKDFYTGRRETITGIVLIPAAVKSMALLTMMGMPSIASFFILCWMLFWGIGALGTGIGKWVAAGGELKALGYERPSSPLWLAVKRRLPGLARPNTAPMQAITTNSLAQSAQEQTSVTENTTRQLDEQHRRPSTQ